MSVSTILMRSTYESVWMTTNKNLFTFQVRACSEAHIALAAIPFIYPDKTYEIIIGDEGNTKCTIRRKVNGDIVKQVSLASLLSCDILRGFWISWEKGNILVGFNTPYTNIFLNWTDSTPLQISSVALSTYKAGPGEWQFSRKFCELKD